MLSKTIPNKDTSKGNRVTKHGFIFFRRGVDTFYVNAFDLEGWMYNYGIKIYKGQLNFRN